MASTKPEIDAALTDWIRAQSMFFVATAPLAGDGHAVTRNATSLDGLPAVRR